MKRHAFSFLSFFLALGLECGMVVCTPALVGAQTGTTSLRGTVSDAKGAVLQDATVTITDPQNGFSRAVKTDGQGEYQFLQLPPSAYTVTVTEQGFAPLKQERVQLLVSVPSTLNFTLQVQGQAVTVEVTGQGAQVNTTDATMGNSPSKAAIPSRCSVCRQA